MEISPEQIRAARGLVDWSQARLADESKVSLRTVAGIEGASRGKPTDANVRALKVALEGAGIVFLDSGEVQGLAIEIGVARRAKGKRK